MKIGNISTNLFASLVILLMVFASARAEAFSLGAIRVTGAFNKQFKAEIPVRTDGRKGLAVWLGSERDYKKLGVKRPSFLGSLTVQVADHPTLPKQKIVYVTSSEPIYQPSFNLVIKASMGGGMILENYFLAVDFQKNLSLELPSSKDEEQEAIEKLAKRLAAKKQPKKKKPATLENIRMEEEKAVQRKETATSFVKNEKKKARSPVKTPAPVIRQDLKPAKAMTKEPAPITPVTTPKPIVTAKPIQQKPVVVDVDTEVVSLSEPVKPAGGVLPVFSDPGANVFAVKRGDSLYKIARKLGAERKDYNRVVVALWKENHKSFIKGNIHGLMAGAKIKYGNVNETVKSITVAEARKIINDQWPEWTNKLRVAPPRKVTKKIIAQPKLIKIPARKMALRSSALAALSDWSKTQNLDDELDLDSAVIVSRDGITEVIVSAKQKEGDKTKVYTIRLSKVDGKYEVVEAVKPDSGGEPSGRPFVLHVASYTSAEPASRLIKFLRLKGHNAYEVSNTLKDGKDWLRVVISRYNTLADADRAAKKIKRSGVSKYTRILMLPYAIRIEEPVTRKIAERKIKELAVRGIYAYTLKNDSDDSVAVLVGAYASEKEAERTVENFSRRGIKCQVVKP
ncbi:hypothetical protein MNBD_NITROSPINAE04-196 [hydrothermal vent metagenome]|uniref:SPOR domain-containing protein n=1 Tax=hydrothermal vent metagenome TaxID=652676 RepID=A0A3B1C6Z1_9ZZZZ